MSAESQDNDKQEQEDRQQENRQREDRQQENRQREDMQRKNRDVAIPVVEKQDVPIPDVESHVERNEIPQQESDKDEDPKSEDGVSKEETEHAASKVCPNCDTPLPEHAHFCSHCGQDAHHTRLPFKHFVMEFIEGLFHFDTKVWLTMKRLFRNPGIVIKDFNDNKRMRYVPPIRLYVFVSVLFFLVASNTVHIGEDEVKLKLSADSTSNRFTITTFNDQLSMDSAMLSALRAIPNISEAQVDSVLRTRGKETSPLNTTILRQMLRSERNEISGDEVGRKFIGAISKLLFLLMPLFAFLVWLFVSPQRLYYTETLVYSIYFHSFVFILMLAVDIVNMMTDASILYGGVYLAASVYTVPSLRTAFGLTWTRSLLLTLALVATYSAIMALFLAATLVGSFIF